MKKTKNILASTVISGTLALQGTISDAQGTANTGLQYTEAVRPFKVHVSDAEIKDLRNRILATRWPQKETVTDETQGVQLATMKALAKYWAKDYDWRKTEARLNSFPHFITNIDGVDIHFIHVKSKEKNAMPVILTHGWPGSVFEFLKMIEPLTNPVAHGGKAEDAFDVVIPSMPGYGFSAQPTTTGWGAERIATAYGELMTRLGYKKYVAQGGDWGALVVDLMGVQQAPGLMAIHTNMPGAVPAEIDKAAVAGGPMPSGLSPVEQHGYERLKYFYAHGLAYALEMGGHPQTLYGIEDSPIGLASWLLDHDLLSYLLISRVFVDGEKEGLTRDDVLDNVSLYWFTKTGVSSSRLYWENKLNFFAPKNVKIPVAVSVYPDELYVISRAWAERAYPNLIYFNSLSKGGHFAAWEQPKSFTEELRAAFKSLR